MRQQGERMSDKEIMGGGEHMGALSEDIEEYCNTWDHQFGIC